ncbi:aminodeoxychorismate synthase component I [Altererythrobacter sp. ZODW24]|uniref:aminodeoxychorismate synthase component I n=1 Tax=Altererythrobacter sp. ZODW24 TaxID=2185142 RepID=UPI001962DF4A|nr:aminodeoxychorismate synthase component I [Altererythrobacter sp. ZODW24]
MAISEPFVLLDDARANGGADAQLFRSPTQVFVAYRADDVAQVLADADGARAETGHTLAGYIAYEAGLALEAKLAPLADARTGANGPLVWLGLFEAPEKIAADEVPNWLAAHGDGRPAQVGPLQPDLSTGSYDHAFAKMQEAIRAGDIYQANLTFPLGGSYRGDPLDLYAAIRPHAAAGYGGIIFDGSHWLLSLSPELFVSLKDGEAKAKPMKGTRPRGQDTAADTAYAEELAVSIKDRAENLMIVDLMRNDLSRVSEAGSVIVENAFAVESYPTVHQMVTTVKARLRDDQSAADMVRALFPCGSITGAPKIRAMELINEVERDPRGPYCGAMGRIDGSGDAAFNVAIRTLRLTPEENGSGSAVLGVGSAIVADSESLPEWRECLVKGGFVQKGEAAGFDLFETMRFDPEVGVPLLEKHLERLKRSAADLGFCFDRHAARNQIQALCFDLDRPAKLRLILAKGGASALEVAPLPAASEEPVKCAILPLPLDEGDLRLRHKTTDRWFYDDALTAAREAGASEALLVRDDGLLTEGSFTSIFVERDGVLLTPPLSLGLLPGVLRHSLIESGKAQESELTISDLDNGFFIGNALRGLLPAQLLT